jgi:hypothetical protein
LPPAGYFLSGAREGKKSNYFFLPKRLGNFFINMNATAIPRKLKSTSINELTRPGMKICAVSTNRDIAAQIRAS